MIEATRVVEVAGRIEQTDLMRGVPRINPNQPGVVFRHRQSLPWLSAVRGVSSSRDWCLRRDSPLEVHHGRTGRGADRPRRSKRRAPQALPTGRPSSNRSVL